MPFPFLEFLYLTPALLTYALFFMLKHSKKIDVIHAHGLNAALVGKFLKNIFSKRCNLSLHAIYELDRRPFMANIVRWILSSFDTILALAERSKMDLILGRVPPDKIKTVSQWVDLTLFKQLDKSKCKKKLGVENKFVILFAGRLIEPKGVLILLDIASRISLEDMVFVFVGDGPLSDLVREEASSKRSIIFAGKVSEKKLIEYYNAADVFALPSQYEEGFARVVLETLYCGTPIIAANKGCLPEMIDSSVGFLVEPTIRDIHDKILFLYENPCILNRLKSNCRKYAEKHFSERNARMIEESYGV